MRATTNLYPHLLDIFQDHIAMAIKSLHTAWQLLVVPTIDEHLVQEAHILLVTTLITLYQSPRQTASEKSVCIYKRTMVADDNLTAIC